MVLWNTLGTDSEKNHLIEKQDRKNWKRDVKCSQREQRKVVWEIYS